LRQRPDGGARHGSVPRRARLGPVRATLPHDRRETLGRLVRRPVHRAGLVSVHPWRRYALAAVAAGRLGNCAAFSRGLFAAIFADGSGPVDDERLAGLARFAGLPGDRLVADLEDPQTEIDHRHNIEAALAAAVFGVPSFVVDGEMFWGNDRLVLL